MSATPVSGVSAPTVSTGPSGNGPSGPANADGALTLTPDRPAPQQVGERITWTATGVGGDSPVYQFSVGPSGAPLRVVRDFSPDNTFVWVPMGEGTYDVRVTVKDGYAAVESMSTVASDAVSSRVTGADAVVTPTANPLVALYSVPPCPGSGSSVYVNFRPVGSVQDDAPWSSTDAKPCVPGHSTNFLVAGLLPGTTYEMVHVAGGTVSAPQRFTTGDLPAALSFPAFTVRQTPGPRSDLSQGTVFHELAAFGSDPAAVNLLATDLTGHVTWYYDPLQSGIDTIFGTSLVPGGTVLVQGFKGEDSVLREVDLAGNTLRETSAAAVSAQLEARGRGSVYGFHHDAQRLPDGKTAVLAYTARTVIVHGTPRLYQGDVVVVLDQDFQVTWSWDSFDYLDVNRDPIGEDTVNEPVDWLHSNAVSWSPSDGNLVVSIRHQDWVIKIDYRNGGGDGHVVWRMGRDGDFAIDSPDPYPWFSHQHNAHYLNDTTLILFDNGNTRCTGDPNCDSRGQVLSVNEQTRRVTPVLNADLGNYSFALGAAQQLPNGNYSFTSGIQGPPSNFFGQTIEVLPDGSKSYVLEVAAPEYRSYRMNSLYGVQPTTASTATTLVGSPNPSVLGRPVTLTATVAVSGFPPVSPTGTVTFFDGGTPLATVGLGVGGTASFSTSVLTVGHHALTARYSGFTQGDYQLAPSTSPVADQVVNLSGTVPTTTTVASSANPTTYGQAVAFTVRVTGDGGTPTGTVNFVIDNGAPVPVALDGSGQATRSFPGLTAGTHAVRVDYLGDVSFAPSSGTLTPAQVVNRADVTAAVAAVPALPTFGQGVTFTVTLSSAAGAPGGTVNLIVDGGTPASLPVDATGRATFTLYALAAGSHVVRADYAGDPNFNPTSATLAGGLVVGKAGSTTVLNVTPDSLRMNQPATLTATVTAAGPAPVTPGGTVTFFDNGTALGAPVSLSGTTAAFTTGPLTPGTHQFTASYGGDANFLASTGSLPNRVAGRGPVGVMLSSSLNAVRTGQSIAFTAVVTPSAPSSSTPTGTVTFLDNGVPLGPGVAIQAGGRAVFTATNLPVGRHTVTARYDGDPNFDTATSAAVNPVVRSGAFFVVGGAPGRVQVRRTSDGSLAADFAPFGSSYTGPVNVALGDINGDGYEDVVAAAAIGSPQVKIFNGKSFADGTFLPVNPAASQLTSFLAFDPLFQGGVTVAAGYVSGTAFADLIVGAGAGNPHVKVYSGQTLAAGAFGNPNAALRASFFAYALGYNIGVNVAAGDVAGSGFADVITAPTVGSPHVKVFSGQAIASGSFANPDANLRASFMAFDLSLGVGAFVAVGDTTGSGFGDVIVGAAGRSPQVKVYSGRAIAAGSFANPEANVIDRFFAYDPQYQIGVRVGAADFENTGRFDILTGTTTGAPHYRVVSGRAGGTLPPAVKGIQGIPDVFRGGVSVGA